MKQPLVLSCLLLSSPAWGGDFIRQIQTVSGASVITDMPITGDTGNVMSQPLGGVNAVFQLYTTITTNNVATVTKMDEKTVGTFLPTVTVTALSEDPHVPARTRADKVYGMTIVISGLQTASATVPVGSSQVQVARSYALYDSTTYAATGVTGTYADAFTFQQNGTFTTNGIIQRLPVAKPTKAVGSETFTVYTDPSLSATQSQLGAATVQIWPVADAAITGITDGQKYSAVPKQGSLTLKDLYPKSTTYAQVYSGPPSLGTVGTVLPSTVVAYDTYSPQNAMLTLSDLPNMVSADGTYTIEVLTVTPFNKGAPERLAYLSFILKRTMNVGTLSLKCRSAPTA
jgi:hypothetical protein